MTTTTTETTSIDPATLPALDSDYALSQPEIDTYKQNGWVLLRQVATTKEVATYRTALTDAAMRQNKQTKPLAERDTYGKAFLQIMNLWRDDPAAARFTLARRFGKIAADLMSVNGVRLYHDQALFKEPGGGHTPWHQDQFYWPLDGVKTVTLWMPLVDADESMGTMRFASGSHDLGYLGAIAISDESEAVWGDLIAEKGMTVAPAGAMRAGDATFHNGWTLHGAPGNQSPTTTREVMTIIYFEDGAHISTPDNPNRESDLRGWFPGLKPGDLAASELNPLVYRRDR